MKDWVCGDCMYFLACSSALCIFLKTTVCDGRDSVLFDFVVVVVDYDGDVKTENELNTLN